MFKKVISILCAVVAVVSCVACGVSATHVIPSTEATTNALAVSETEIIKVASNEPVEEIVVPVESVTETEPEPTKPQTYERYTEVPIFYQSDYPFSSYGNYGTVSSHGCGITSLAMVTSYLLDDYYSPHDLAQRFGKYNGKHGSSWNLFGGAAEKLGITMEKKADSKAEVIEALKEGKVVISNARSGSYFTNGGHYIVFAGITEDNKVIVNDPYKGNYCIGVNKILKNGFKNGFDKSELVDCGNCWIFSAKDPSVITNTIEVKNIPYEIVKNEDMLNYYLYTPSVVDSEAKTPLIVWLHDYWGSTLGEIAFTHSELPYEFRDWMLDEFNAYVVCPQMPNTARNWSTDKRAKQIDDIIADISATHNIDEDRIIIMGQGTGGEGALFMMNHNPEKYSAVVSFAPYNRDGVKLKNFETPIKLFIGTREEGEANEAITAFNGKYKKNFNAEDMFTIETSHAELVKEVFRADEDGNGQSDIIEWALAQ